jgi:hypothetical protein
MTGAAILCSLLNFAALDATRANLHSFGCAIHKCAHALQIDVPPALRHVVSVADSVAELRAAATEFTIFRHKTGISFDL